MSVRVLVIGAAGRLGSFAIRVLSADPNFTVVAAVGRVPSQPPDLQVPIETNLWDALERTAPDVVLDLSVGRFALKHAKQSHEAGCHTVIGCTGIPKEDLAILRTVADANPEAPILVIPNFSFGAVLGMQFAAMAAKWFAHCEIIEMHHDRKLDAPSGTALLTADRINAARDTPFDSPQASTLKVEGVRGGEVGGVNIHSIRMRGALAHQKVLLGNTGELLTIQHDSMSLASFEAGIKLAIKESEMLKGFHLGLECVMNLTPAG